jgi:hypothetical protein
MSEKQCSHLHPIPKGQELAKTNRLRQVAPRWRTFSTAENEVSGTWTLNQLFDCVHLLSLLVGNGVVTCLRVDPLIKHEPPCGPGQVSLSTSTWHTKHYHNYCQRDKGKEDHAKPMIYVLVTWVIRRPPTITIRHDSQSSLFLLGEKLTYDSTHLFSRPLFSPNAPRTLSSFAQGGGAFNSSSLPCLSTGPYSSVLWSFSESTLISNPPQKKSKHQRPSSSV